VTTGNPDPSVSGSASSKMTSARRTWLAELTSTVCVAPSCASKLTPVGGVLQRRRGEVLGVMRSGAMR